MILQKDLNLIPYTVKSYTTQITHLIKNNEVNYYIFTAVSALPLPDTHYSSWWLKLHGLLRILARHESNFEHVEAKLMQVTDVETHDHHPGCVIYNILQCTKLHQVQWTISNGNTMVRLFSKVVQQNVWLKIDKSVVFQNGILKPHFT